MNGITMRTDNSPVTIKTHWDIDGLITRDSDPEAEFKIWAELAAMNPDFQGDEFELEDFENHINFLKKGE